MSTKQVTVRNVTPELAERLRELAKSRGESVNATILFILSQYLDVNERRKRLARYATWSKKDHAEFQQALGAQRTIDESLWE